MNWLKNLKITHKLGVAGLTVLFIICLIEATAFFLFHSSHKETNNFINKAEILQEVINARLLLEQTLMPVNDYLITGSHEEKKAFKEISGAFEQKVQKLENKLVNTEYHSAVKELEAVWFPIKKDANAILNIYSPIGNSRGAEMMEEMDAKVEKANTIVDSLNNKINQEKISVKENLAKKWQELFFIFVVLDLLIACLLIAISYFTLKTIILPLQNMLKSIEKDDKGNIQIKNVKIDSTDEIGQLGNALNTLTSQVKIFVQQVKITADDVFASSQEMSKSSEQTAQSSEQTAESTAQLAKAAQEISRNVEDGVINLNKMNKIVQNILNDANLVAKLGNDSEENANEGAEYVKKAVNKIDSIKQVSGDISVNITELGQLSSEIEQIVDLIKNIAGQTNLLALNAAIEAARAGEHGKGFAVVADEVKKLAGQSAGATEKITLMIKEIQNKTSLAVSTMNKATQEVDEGVFVVNDAGKALENIITQVKAANIKIQGITQEIDGVANNSEEMVKMIENISAITEETAASAEEISSITEEQTASMKEISASSQTLASSAEKLNKQVSIFKI